MNYNYFYNPKTMRNYNTYYNICIIGYRKFEDYNYFSSIVDNILNNYIIDYDNICINIISGGGKGTDELAKVYATNNNFGYFPFPPWWNVYGLRAYPIRNTEMLNISSIIIAFNHDDSKETKNMIKQTAIYNNIHINNNKHIFIIDIN